MRRLPLVFVALLALLAGCVPSEPAFDPSTGAGLDAVVEHFQTLDPDEQLSQVAGIDTRTERGFWKLAGIDDALGGEKAADNVFGEVQRAMLAYVDPAESGTDGIIARAAFRDGYGDGLGMGTYTNMLTSATGGDVGLNQTDGSDVSGTRDLGEGMKITITSNGGTVTVTITIDTTIKGIELHSKTESVILKDQGGSMTTNGKHTVQSPVGTFTKPGKMTFTLTAIKKCS